MTAFGTCARAKSAEPFFHHWQVHPLSSPSQYSEAHPRRHLRSNSLLVHPLSAPRAFPPPFLHFLQEVHRQLRARRSTAAPRDGDGDGDGTVQQCGLPEDFYESNEAHSLGLWLLGGETTVAERQLLVEEPGSAALDALLVRRSLEAADYRIH